MILGVENSGQAQNTCLPNYWNIKDLKASDPDFKSRQAELGGRGPPVIVTGLNLAQASPSFTAAPAAPQDYMQKKDIYYYTADLELTNKHSGVKGDYVDHDAGPWGVSATSSYDGLPYRKVIYVKGDLEIKDNIKTNLSGFIDPQNSDYVYLIVRGNIYIHPEVERLDAVLVAYPKEHSSSTRTSPAFEKDGSTLVRQRLKPLLDPVLLSLLLLLLLLSLLLLAIIILNARNN